MKISQIPMLLALCSGAFLTRDAQATLFTYSYSGGTVNIPDNNAGGASVDINVTDTWDLLSFQSVSFTGTHTWVGDLVVTLTHIPTGTTIDLFRRVGKTAAGSGFGDNSNLNGTYTFADGALTRMVDAANAVGGGTAVAPGTYRATSNLFNGDGSPTFTGEALQNLDATFSPISNLSGIWRLQVTDLAGSDVGSITAFSFTVDAVVPEPGSMLLLGTAVLAGGIWQRRKSKAAAGK